MYEETYDAKDEEIGADSDKKQLETEGNLEGQKRVTSYKCKEVSSRSVGGDCVATRGTSSKMSSEPTIAKFKVKGYATLTSLFLLYTAVAGNSVYRVVLSVRRITNRSLLKFSDKNRNENRGTGREVPKQDPFMYELYCDLYFLACHDDSQSCRRSPRRGM